MDIYIYIYGLLRLVYAGVTEWCCHGFLHASEAENLVVAPVTKLCTAADLTQLRAWRVLENPY